MPNEHQEKHTPPQDGLLEVGQVISFEFMGRKVIGPIEQIGDHGYWVAHTYGCSSGSGGVRCPFEAATLVS